MNATTLQRSQLGRLLQIVVALQSDRRPNARQLAEECEVSRRTIFRDFEAIEMAGLKVEYDAASQGYRIAATARLDLPALEEREVLALTVLVNRWADLDPFGLACAARSGLFKLVGGLSTESRRRIEALDESTRSGIKMPPVDESRRRVYDTILEALLHRVQVRLTVREPGGTPETTCVEPYRLVPVREGWCVVGRSSLHRRVRLLPLAWVDTVESTDDPATTPPRFRPDRWLARTWSGEPGPGRREVHLRFDAEAAPTIRDGQWHPSQRIEAHDDGRIDLRITVDRPEDLTGWVLGHGEHVEVIAPARLRKAVRRMALKVVRGLAGPRRPVASPPDFGGQGG